MMRTFRLVFLAIALSVCSLPAFPWSGPQVSIDNKNGRKIIKICDQGGACTQSTPFFLGINTGTNAIVTHDWTTFMYEAQLQAGYVGSGGYGVIPMLQVNLLNTSDAFLDELAAHLNQLSPRPYLFVRFYLQTVAQPGMELTKLANLQGQVHDDSETSVTATPWAFNEAWLSYQENEIARVLTRIDSQYAGRVMGAYLTYEIGGEWRYLPYAYNDATAALQVGGDGNLCRTGLDGVSRCGFFHFTNDSGTQPGPIGRLFFSLHDYSVTTKNGFCAWSALPTGLQPGCRAATVTERNNAIPGLPLPTLGTARGVFLDPTDINSQRAAYYNRFVSTQNVNAITRLLAKAKQVSGNRVLTAAPYGYLHALETTLPISGQTALGTLINSNAIDLIVAPYSYGTGPGARELGSPFSAQGPTDTPRLNNKLWTDEDDTRTHLASAASGFKTVNTLLDSLRILRRNLLTAGLHGRASYFFDLPGTGWFGRPDQGSDSENIWASVYSVFTGLNKLQLNIPNKFDAQVAVFVDDLSPNYVAGLTPAGDASYAFTTDVSARLIDDLDRLGTPVKQYLLSDLLKSNLDLSAIKFAILANAWNVPSTIRQAINTKLKTPGRTVLFIYASGYLNQDAAPSVNNISSLTGITVMQGSGPPPVLSETFNVNGQVLAGGPDYPLTPWFTINDAAASTLATYNLGGVSLARKTISVSGGSYASVYAAAPRLPREVLRKLSEDAGVHHFVPVGDSVEAAGNMLMVHAASTGIRTITLPGSRPRVFETALYPSETLLCSACASLSQLAFNAGDTRAFRWTSGPGGNFELISSGPTLEGWAVDFDTPDTPIIVHIYKDGPAGTGTFLTYFVADRPRPDLTAAFGIAGNNGFRVNIGSCPSGTQLYAYAIDSDGVDGNPLIGVHTCP